MCLKTGLPPFFIKAGQCIPIFPGRTSDLPQTLHHPTCSCQHVTGHRTLHLPLSCRGAPLSITITAEFIVPFVSAHQTDFIMIPREN